MTAFNEPLLHVEGLKQHFRITRHYTTKAVDGISFDIYPGETYSFNEVVGPRTEVRGYEKATEYAGNSTQQNWGGGVCLAAAAGGGRDGAFGGGGAVARQGMAVARVRRAGAAAVRGVCFALHSGADGAAYPDR